MDNHECLNYVVAILTTALETEPDPFPESMAYLAMGMDMDKWQTVRHVLLDCGMVTIEGNVIRLTAHGRDVASKCNAALVK